MHTGVRRGHLFILLIVIVIVVVVVAVVAYDSVLISPVSN